MITIKAFRTYFSTAGPHPARIAPALSITRTAATTILAGTFLSAVETIGAISTWGSAAVSLPSRHTEARPSYRVALSIILASAFLDAIQTPSVHRACLATSESCVSWFARALPSDVMAGSSCMHTVRTCLRAVLAKSASRT